MKMGALRNNPKLYSKLLTSITLCIALTLLVSTSIYYIYYTKVEKEQAFQSVLSHLMLTSKEVATMTETAQSLSFQIYRNSTISKLMFYPDPNIYDVTAAMSELGNYLSSMPYIESIYVYNPNSDVIYISSSRGQNGFFTENELLDTDILRVLDHYQDYKPFTPIPRSYHISDEPGQVISTYTYLCYDAIGWERSINSAVIVNLSSSWINKDIASGAPFDGKSFILDDKGRILSGASLTESNLGDMEHQLINDKIRGQQSGYFVANFDGINSLVTHTTPDDMGWQYVRVTPYDIVTKQTNTIRNTTLTIAIAILLVGLIVSRTLSRRLYIPIGRVVTQMNALEAERRNGMFTIRQNTLRNLVLGVKTLRTHEQLEKMRQFGIVFNFNEDFRLVLLRIDEYAKFKEIRGSDLQAYKFAIMNIATEVCVQTYRVETVDVNEDSVLILLNIHDPVEHTVTELLETLLRQIREASLQYLKIGLSLTYSPVESQPEQLHSLFIKVKEASQHRLFYGHGSIINAQEITALQLKTYEYPSDKEKKLIDALMTGKAEDAKILFSEIMLETADYPFHVVQLAFSRLTVTTKGILDNIQKRSGLTIVNGPDFQSIDNFETVTQLIESFLHWFDDIQDRLSQKRNSKQDVVVRRINELVQLSFADPNFSLNIVADELNMSPIYLSRLYKQQTLLAIADVILETRMHRACELLEQTDWSVATISEHTGFTSSSYFHRMFKRTFGVTPSDFRRSQAT
jgi:two-component system response regulator YesN